MIYKIVDGHKILADVHPASTGELGPAILFIHGGALIMGNRSWISPDQLLKYAEAGFTVVSIDYRLAPETKLPEIVADVQDAHDWMRTEGSAQFSFDADRVAIVGFSAGGYLALLSGDRFRPRPRAVVSYYGYGDLTGPWYSQPSDFYNQAETIVEKKARAAVGASAISEGPDSPISDRQDFYVFCRQQGIWPEEVSGVHSSNRDWYAPFEPLRNVSSDFPPTLLVHGEADTDVPFEQSVLMAQQLERHGVVHEFVSDTEWGHAFDLLGANDSKVQELVDRTVKFLLASTCSRA